MRWGKSVAVLLGLALVLWLRVAQGDTPSSGAAAAAPEHSSETHILVFGDSLSAEYGLPRGTGWVQHVERRLAQRDQAYQIRNASISGDTTSGGLQRLPQVLGEFDADIVILQLGANDGLRGLPINEMTSNLRKMIELIHAEQAKVLLVGQHVPPNYGQRYSREFHAAYASLSDETGTALVPFMLEGIATNREMFQDDGLHPTVEAQQHIADTIWPHLEALLDQASE